MDELKMVGDLLEAERPASERVTAGARGRLMDEIGAKRRRMPRFGTGRRWTLLGVVCGVTAALVIVPTLLLDGDRSVQAPPGERPQKQSTAMNVLVVGSDSRLGASGARAFNARADTVILLHVSADRAHVRAISLPRDTMVRIPACTSADGRTARARLGTISTSFSTGGITCTWKTVESTTGVHVDHAIEIDFSGLKSIVDALGGVEVTVPRAVNDPSSGLRLPAGRHVVKGDQALAYARSRRGLGDGSDLTRIRNQQRLMAALLRRASERFTDPARLYAFLQVVDKSIATDPGLDLKTMYAIAWSLRDIEPGALRITTAPVRPFPADRNRLEWAPAAARILAEIKNDRM